MEARTGNEGIRERLIFCSGGVENDAVMWRREDLEGWLGCRIIINERYVIPISKATAYTLPQR